MIDLKASRATVVACISEMEAVHDRMEEVKGKTDMSDEDKKHRLAELDGVYKDLKAKTDVCKVDLVRAEEIASVRDLAAKIQKAAEVTPTNVEPAEAALKGKVDAQAVDRNKEEQERTSGFLDWMSGKAVSEKFAESMQPKSQKLMGKSEPGMAMVMPAHMAHMVLGFRGKADGLLKSDGAHGESDLFDDEFRPRLLELPPEPGVVFPRTTKVPTTTGTVKWPRLVQTDGDEHGTVAVAWISEAAEKTATEPSFEQLTITTNELAAQTQISRTLLRRSAINLEMLVPQMFRNAIVNEMDNVILDGSGSGRPLGVIKDSDVRVVLRKTVDKIEYADLVKMKYALRANHRPGSLWVIADDAVEELISLKDSDGRPFFVPNPLAGQMDRLLGIPMVTTHRTTFKSAGDAILGDWSQYIVAVEQEVLVQRSEHRHMEKNVILFVVSVLVGGRAALPRAFAYLKASTS